MKHISQFSFIDNKKVKPIYTAFIKDNTIVLGFNDGEILPMQKECTIISTVETQPICKCTILYFNPTRKLNTEWSIVEHFRLCLNNKALGGLLSFEIKETEHNIISEITFTVYCNIISWET